MRVWVRVSHSSEKCGAGGRTTLEDDSLAQEDELVGLLAERDRVRAQQTSFAREESLGTEDLVEEVAAWGCGSASVQVSF